MRRPIPVYLEVGRKRVFAGALEWPGWCRSGRSEDEALASLLKYGARYEAAVLGPAAADGFAAEVAAEFAPPTDLAGLAVVERLKGNATTDFGAPAIAPAGDRRPLDEPALERQAALLRACWAAFDRAAAAAAGAVLAKGPRGGGRELDAIVAHVQEAERTAYLARLGGTYRRSGAGDRQAEVAHARAAVLETLAARARGDPLPPSRRTAPLWAPRYFVRRAAWHVLDHAWEIEDRAASPRPTAAGR